jgi:hypothetical protein
MATASGTTVWLARGVVKVTWLLTGTVTVGRPARLPNLPDKVVHVRGTFAGGGTVSVSMFGSNASGGTGALATSSAFALNDSRGEGNALAFTAPDGRQINENPNLIFPKLTVASGATAITIEVVAQSAKR